MIITGFLSACKHISDHVGPNNLVHFLPFWSVFVRRASTKPATLTFTALCPEPALFLSLYICVSMSVCNQMHH